jgi:hypothetical protein
MLSSKNGRIASLRMPPGRSSSKENTEVLASATQRRAVRPGEKFNARNLTCVMACRRALIDTAASIPARNAACLSLEAMYFYRAAPAILRETLQFVLSDWTDMTVTADIAIRQIADA